MMICYLCLYCVEIIVGAIGSFIVAHPSLRRYVSKNLVGDGSAIAQAAGSRSFLAPARSFQDACQQTPMHFVEKNMDPAYEWNEWALRRRALDLANLRQKATHSTQTVASALRRVHKPVSRARPSALAIGVEPSQRSRHRAWQPGEQLPEGVHGDGGRRVGPADLRRRR